MYSVSSSLLESSRSREVPSLLNLDGMARCYTGYIWAQAVVMMPQVTLPTQLEPHIHLHAHTHTCMHTHPVPQSAPPQDAPL